jgi:hypothetical protein
MHEECERVCMTEHAQLGLTGTEGGRRGCSSPLCCLGAWPPARQPQLRRVTSVRGEGVQSDSLHELAPNSDTQWRRGDEGRMADPADSELDASPSHLLRKHAGIRSVCSGLGSLVLLDD